MQRKRPRRPFIHQQFLQVCVPNVSVFVCVTVCAFKCAHGATFDCCGLSFVLQEHRPLMKQSRLTERHWTAERWSRYCYSMKDTNLW